MTCPKCRTPLALDRAIAGLVVCTACASCLTVDGRIATGADVDPVSHDDVLTLRKQKNAARKALTRA